MKTKKLTRAQKEALGLKKPVVSAYEIRQEKKRQELIKNSPRR